MKSFAAPRESLGELNVDTAARLIATAADIALVVDSEGVIRDYAVDSREFGLTGLENWLGQPWADTVTVESRPKIEALIREAFSSERTRWRHVNYQSPQGADVPVLYSALRMDDGKRLVAFGRDLRTISSLQQRLIEAQQTLEKDYSRLRHLETRYRLLFQLSQEPVLVVDGASDKILEANPAALRALDTEGAGIVGKRLPALFPTDGARTVEQLLATVRATGRADDVAIALPGGEESRAAVSLLRQDNAWVFLVRLTRGITSTLPGRAEQLDISGVVAAQPDAFVLTTADSTILSCNTAFLEMAEVATEEIVRGETLDRWLGRPGVDLSVLTSNLREHGLVRLFATVIRGDYGTETEVEISAAASQQGERTVYGFAIRDVSRRFAGRGGSVVPMPQSVEQLTELVGRVSLKDLVRQTTDMIEKMYIEAALEMTGDNRASAAEMLGLSRQSLYVKLRRFGLRDFTDGTDSE